MASYANEKLYYKVGEEVVGLDEYKLTYVERSYISGRIEGEVGECKT